MGTINPLPQKVAVDADHPAPATEQSPFPLTDVDKWVLSLSDEEFPYHDWEDMKDIVGT